MERRYDRSAWFFMRGALIVSAAILGSAVAHGHHSITAVYDRARPVTLEAVVVEFQLVQPHAFLIVDVEGRDDVVRWRGEMDNRRELVAIGMAGDTFKPGDRVVVSGSRSRTQPNALYVLRLDRPADGFWYEQVGMSPKIGTKD